MIKTLLSMLCNAAIVCMTVLSIRKHIRRCKKETGRSIVFRFFTTDSNVLAGAAALLVLIFEAALVGEGAALPDWVLLIKYAASVAVGVTFLTVMVFLGPTIGYGDLLKEESFYMHVTGPMLAIISFCFLETGMVITWAQTLLGVLPTLVYGAVYVAMVIVRGESKGGWEDFYGFNRGGKWPVSLAAMLIGTYALSVLLRGLHNAMI